MGELIVAADLPGKPGRRGLCYCLHYDEVLPRDDAGKVFIEGYYFPDDLCRVSPAGVVNGKGQLQKGLVVNGGFHE